MVWFGFLFLFFLDLMEIKFGNIVFGLNGLQWVFSQNPIITGLNWVDTHLTQLIIGWVWVQLSGWVWAYFATPTKHTHSQKRNTIGKPCLFVELVKRKTKEKTMSMTVEDELATQFSCAEQVTAYNRVYLLSLSLEKHHYCPFLMIFFFFFFWCCLGGGGGGEEKFQS